MNWQDRSALPTFSHKQQGVMDITTYQAELERELTGNILPFYSTRAVDVARGGFFGRIDHTGQVDGAAAKGVVQHGRLLWTFSRAYRWRPDPTYRQMADHAYTFLRDYFWDEAHGGLYWLVAADGRPLANHKLIYGQAFGLYGFSEYARATRERAAWDTAVALYHLIEQHAADPAQGGYFDAFHRDWSPYPEINVDQVPGHVPKTMNTHLHILEAYTNLLAAWDDPGLRARQYTLIRLMLDHILNRQTGHLQLHFTADWQSLTPHISYGHDIEANWLLVEAAEQVGDEALLAEVTAVADHIAHITLQEGVDASGGIFNEGDANGVCDRSKDWWPQAEGMVGFFQAYQLTGEERFLQASWNCWRFVQQVFIDRKGGDWFAHVSADNTPGPRDKAGIWKTPYHNGRACLELIQRV